MKFFIQFIVISCVEILFFKNVDSLSISGYKGAVLEHQFMIDDRCLQIADIKDQASCIKKGNLLVFLNHVKTAAAENADIIVFPEHSLHGWVDRDRASAFSEDVPSPGRGWTPCLNAHYEKTHTAQYFYSCMAKQYNMYVVGNCIDRKIVQNNQTGLYLYNAAVAYDPKGALVARYHKYNLFDIELTIFDRPSEAEISFFDAPFGRVGLIICFDILFRDPTYDLVEKYGVEEVAFPTNWIDELPMWSAVGVHSSWAMTMKVNLLSANYRLAHSRMLGSGLFSPKGPIAFTRDLDQSGSILLVKWIPKVKIDNELKFIPHPSIPENTDTFVSMLFHDPHKFTYIESGAHTKKICMNSFCCSFRYNVTIPEGEHYAFGVFYGLHTAAQQHLTFQNCVLTKCANSDQTSCGQSVSNGGAKFSYFHLQGNFKAKYIFPTVLYDNVQLPKIGAYQFLTVNNAYILSEEGFPEAVLMADLHGRMY